MSQHLSNCNVYKSQLEDPQVQTLTQWVWGLRFCILIKLPDNAEVAGLWTILSVTRLNGGSSRLQFSMLGAFSEAPTLLTCRAQHMNYGASVRKCIFIANLSQRHYPDLSD